MVDQVEAVKEQKTIEDKSDDKLSMEKETYNRLLGERLNEIQKISNKIDFDKLTYYFKTSAISLLNLIKFKGPFGFFKEIRDGDKLLKGEEEQIKFKSELDEITRGKPKDKSKDRLDTIKNLKLFMIQDKKLSIYLMITQKLDPKPFIKQNKMKQNRELQKLKY